MKQYINKYLFVCLAVLLLTGCDDYLDIVPKGTKVLASVEDYELLFNNETMQNYGVDNVLYLSDEWLNPIVLANSWGSAPNYPIIKFMGLDPATNNRLNLVGSSAYTTCYARINKICNLTLSTIDNVEGDNALRNWVKAQAYALRAYNYFVLISQYAKPYSQNSVNEIGIPLYLEFNLDEYPEQASVAKVYQAIEEDLEKAIPLLTEERPNNYFFSKAAAYTLKAKVHLFKREFAKAKEAAMEAYKLNNFVFDLVAYNAEGMTYKSTGTNQEFLYFAYPTSDQDANMSTICRDLFLKFDTINDVRYTGFMSFNSTGAGNPASTDPNLQGDSKYVPGWDSKLKGATNYRYNVFGLRTTDPMLMLAECYARENDFDNMKKYLDEVRKKRIKDYTTASENPANWVDAVNIVIEERRKEFMFGYNRYWDLKRLNMEPEFKAPVKRTAPENPNFNKNGVVQKEYTLDPDSYLWIIPLPQSEFGLYPDLKYNVPY